MNIGIIGAGNIGGTLTRRLAALGYNVSVANSRRPESLAGLARETGAHAVTVEEAARARECAALSSRPARNAARSGAPHNAHGKSRPPLLPG
jgi:predicted dinucleotide-binding enzyme